MGRCLTKIEDARITIIDTQLGDGELKLTLQRALPKDVLDELRGMPGIDSVDDDTCATLAAMSSDHKDTIPLEVTAEKGRPGVLGKIGTLIAAAQVNIHAVSMPEVNGESVLHFDLAKPLPAATLHKIQRIDAVSRAESEVAKPVNGPSRWPL